ncbi:MAG: ATP-dependent helicase [Candidatus Aenigmarchaeota archaeon]|nr:ATP-dependent helicase [Candidatus Aenigmarchaeota archaeon]
MSFEPNTYQEAIFEWIRTGTGNAVVGALAGTGKTTTNVEALSVIPKNQSVLMTAFNKHIQVEMEKKAPDHIKVQTLHSLGLGAISSFNHGFPTVDANKVQKIFNQVVRSRDDKVSELMKKYENEINTEKKKKISDQIIEVNPLSKSFQQDIFAPVLKIVSLLKATMLPVNMDSINTLIHKHDISASCDSKEILSVIDEIMMINLQSTTVVDFDDMIYLPVMRAMPTKKYDWVLIDECQDISKSQLFLTLKCLKETGRLLAVGDEFQAIYGFRAADPDAVQTIIKMTKANVMPLSICYRCPTSHIELAKRFVPSIEAVPNASKGAVIPIATSELIDYIKPGDICICRNNAPLVSPAFTLLRNGVKVVIKGQDIGVGLISLIKKLKANSLSQLEDRLELWMEEESVKAQRKHKSIDSIMDKYNCLLAFTDSVDRIQDLTPYIKQLFSDDNGEVTFSSIHRAKGLEADNIFFLKPSLIPSPYASQPWEMQQERNCYYIAVTRAKQNLFMVED